MTNLDLPEQYVAYFSAKDLRQYGIDMNDVKAGIVRGVGIDPLYSKGASKYQVTQEFLDSIESKIQDEASILLDADDAA